MIHEIFMPALSSTMTEGKITAWVKSAGDKVEKGETVVIVESDKADMDVESFYEGYLATIVVPAGESAPVGAAIALLAETAAEIEQANQQAASLAGGVATAAAPESVAAAATPPNGQIPAVEAKSSDRVVISPRARKLAQELRVDLANVRGSGPHGRIVAQDVETAAGRTPAVPASAVTLTVMPTVSAPVAKPAAPVPLPVTPGQTVPLTTLQNAVVRNMVASLEIPAFRAGYTITTAALDQLYRQLKPKGVTMSVLLAKAVAVALQRHPLLYARYTDQGIHYNAEINIAMAVAMEDGGLITPVLRRADQTDIYSLSRSWKDLVDRARLKQLQPDEYSTGTFTISNLGMFGVDSFDAIVPPGMGAILAIGASQPQVVATPDGMFGVKSRMRVNISCDHRVIYGAHAAAFLKDLATLIETNPQSLTL
jgi:pyruvate dehydrogenase E2 component (dihydrolipoamide acetyltransferase)